MNPLRPEYEYFVTLCETLNISRASEILDMTQGSLSKILKKLEKTHKSELFIRKGRGLQITEHGRALNQSILQLQNSWELSQLKTEEELEQVNGFIKIGAHQSIAIDLLADKLPKINEKYHSLDLKLIFNSSKYITREVIEHNLDFGCVANPVQHPDLVIKKLRSEHVGIFSRKSTHHKKIIFYNPDMINLIKVLSKFKNYKHVPVQDYEVLAAMSRQSDGVFILPTAVAERYKSLKLLGVKGESVDICLIYNVDRPKTKTFMTVLEELSSIHYQK